MEAGPADVIYRQPAHPYTRALLQSVPIPNPDLQRARRAARQRGAPDLAAAVSPESCHFAPRCPWAADACRQRRPAAELTDRKARRAPCNPLDAELKPYQVTLQRSLLSQRPIAARSNKMSEGHATCALSHQQQLFVSLTSSFPNWNPATSVLTGPGEPGIKLKSVIFGTRRTQLRAIM